MSQRSLVTKLNNDNLDNGIVEVEEEEEEEELDPRVQEELEKLNNHTDAINKLELQLEDANCLFRTLLTDSTHQLKAMAQKVGYSNIEKARPYFEAMEVANKAQKDCQSAVTAFQRANGIHAAAKETIALAEQRFLSNSTSWQFDNAWQEMLNHATMKVMEAEKQKTESEAEHLQRAAFYTAAEQACQRLEKRLKKHVVKAQPYFEQKEAFNKTLEAQKLQVQSLQEKVSHAKAEYAKSLRKLEEISESIHAQRRYRRKMVQLREPGVGAEQNLRPMPSNFDLYLDLESCDRGSLRSTVSGQSSSKAESSDGLDLEEPETFNDKKTDPDKVVSRTRSCPDNMMSQALSTMSLKKDDENS